MSFRPRFLSALAAVFGLTFATAQIASCAFEPFGTEPPEQSTPCVDDSNCDDQNPCTIDDCLPDGTCSRTNEPDGPLAQQTAGDCSRNDCASGVLVPTNDDADIEDDGEPCTTDSCGNGSPVHAAVTEGTMCTMGTSPGSCVMGVCIVVCSPTKPCDDGNPCTEDSCNAGAGTCTFVPLDGLPTPGANQTVGDCKLQICTNGADTAINDDADVPDDMNSCTQNVCMQGVPSNPGVSAGTPCVVGQPEVCDGVNACVQCNVPADCVLLPADDDCQTRTCVNHMCGQTFTQAGTPITAQTTGDCKRVVCDGTGGTAIENFDTDVPEDNNPCTKNVCNAGVPDNPDEALNFVCGVDQYCDGMGQCVGCNTADQCEGTDDFCKTRTCINKVCGYDFTPAGTDLPDGQTAQDCKVVECDGVGNIVTSVDGLDKPVDGNQCTQDVCSMQGVPSNPFENVNFPCNQSGGTVCNGAGACKKADGEVCAAAADCLNGNCVDGVCCDTTCGDTCKSCNVAGSIGTCTDVPKGTEDFGCTGSNSCDGASTCKKDDAQGCAAGSECVSGFCIDGVCCASACTTACRACNLMGTIGICTPITSGEDNVPANVCTGTKACDMSGVCKTKDGSACTTGSECLSGHCYDGVCCDVACSGTCKSCNIANAIGICSNVASGQDDANGVPSCTGANQSCDGMGTCKSVNAEPCTANAECLSGFCVDNVCCDTACSGICQACTAALQGGGSDGVCGNIAIGTDPQDECANGSCNGSAACKLDLGSACSVGSQCLSNFCVDGVCCNTACTGTCQACSNIVKGQGADGTCGPIITNTDPDNECMDGACNGASACELDQGIACTMNSQCLSNFCVDGFCCDTACTDTCKSCGLTGSQGTCSNVPANQDDTGTCSGTNQSCDGNGVCKKVNGETCAGGSECLSNFCVDGVCCDSACTDTCKSCGVSGMAGTCSNVPANQDDADTCTGTNQSCDGLGTCKDANGEPCMAGAECLSGFCVDNVCCNSACSGICEACTAAIQGQGVDGTCGPIAVGTDPSNECATQAAATCGTTGFCSGTGTCALYSSGTTCGAESCTGTTQQNTDTCDGTGTCVDNGTTNCSPYNCGATACKTSCTGDADCVSTHYCAGVACAAKKTNGQVCAASNECSSNFCVDGFCCDTACSDTCKSCGIAGFQGTCSNVPASQNDADTCSGANQACDGMGLCKAINGETCMAGAECLSGFCVDGNCCDSLCDGICSACSNGLTGQPKGTCAPVIAGSDPDDDCATQAPTTCGTSGVCAAGGTCAFYDTATECAAVSCVGSTQQNADMCNGTGMCADGGSTDCSPYICDATTCKTFCTMNSDCVAGFFCAGGTCVATLANGAACTATEQCTSGNCVDGVCCDTACMGTCNACDVTGLVGTCSNVPLGDDDTNATVTCSGVAQACDGNGNCLAANGQACAMGTECASGNCIDGVCCDTTCTGDCQACSMAKKGSGADGVCGLITAGFDPDDECADQGAATCGTSGFCDGAGACELYVLGTECSPATCSMGVQSNIDVCDGSGTCIDNGTVECSPYICGMDACLAMCAADTDCATGYFCDAGVCVEQLTEGATCAGTNECASGFCTDGVCCDEACSGTCRSCLAADQDVGGVDGICGPILVNTDPADECAGASTCDGAGVCN